MTPVPIYLLLSATMGVGVYLGVNHLKRTRARAEIIGLHFLLGAACLEPTAIVLHGGLGGGAKPPLWGVLCAAFIAGALLTGVFAALIGRSSRGAADLAVSLHALAALGAAATMLAWGFRL